MSKAVKIVVVVAIAALSFIAGVKSSEQVKSHASWMFESKDDEVALPDLSNEEIEGATVEGQDVLTNGKEAAVGGEVAPAAAMAPADSVAETAPAAKK